MEKEDVFNWVNQEMEKIKVTAYKFLSYSPYQIEEFIAQAYLSALEAQIKASNNCKPFKYYFWSEYINACRNMTYIKKTSYKEKCPTHINIDEIDISFTQEVKKSKHPEITASEVLELMTKKQKKVWQEFLDGKTYKEIAQKLNISIHAVQKLKDNGIKKAIQKLNESHSLVAIG